MSTSSRARLSRTLRVVLVLAAVCGCAIATACGPSEECLRLSDCDEGLTCSGGRCRAPSEIAPATTDAAPTNEGGSTSPDAAGRSPTDAASSSDGASDGGVDAADADASAG